MFECSDLDALATMEKLGMFFSEIAVIVRLLSSVRKGVNHKTN